MFKPSVQHSRKVVVADERIWEIVITSGKPGGGMRPRMKIFSARNRTAGGKLRQNSTITPHETVLP